MPLRFRGHIAGPFLRYSGVSLFANYYLFDSLGMVADVVMREHKLSGRLRPSVWRVQHCWRARAARRRFADRSAVPEAIDRAVWGAVGAGRFLTFAAPHFYLLLLARFILGLGGEPLGVAVSTALAIGKAKTWPSHSGVNLTFASARYGRCQSFTAVGLRRMHRRPRGQRCSSRRESA